MRKGLPEEVDKNRLLREYNRTFFRQAKLASEESRLVSVLYKTSCIMALLAGGALSLVMYLYNPQYGIILPVLYFPLLLFSVYIWGRSRDESMTKSTHIITASITIAVSLLILLMSFSDQ